MRKMMTDSKLRVLNVDMDHKITMMNIEKQHERMNHRVKSVTQTSDDYSPIILTKTLFDLFPSNSP